MIPDTRLNAIISEITGPVVADIGSDHGYVAVAALAKANVKRVVAADISGKCLEKTVRLAREKGVSDSVETVVSDGFSDIAEHIDTAVIAGLGGYETIKILEKAKALDRVPEKLILCPHQNAFELRAYLDGFRIDKDYIVESGGKFYPVIVAVKGGGGYNADELRFGKNLPPTEDFFKMLRTRKRVLEDRFSGREMPPRVRAEYEEILGLCLE